MQAGIRNVGDLSWSFLVRASAVLLALCVEPLALAQDTERGREIYKKAARSVFLLVTKSKGGQPIAQGSGFLVAGSRIVTARHLISGDSVVVDLGSARVPAKIERVDALNDLAVLSVAVEMASEPLSFASSAPLPGDAVFAIGNPQGLERSISAGVVSGVRQIEGRQLLQISTPISPGSSGGPILNRAGEVVGVAVGLLESGQNLNFAVPATLVRRLLSRAADSADAGLVTIAEIEALRIRQGQMKYSADPDSEWQQLEQRLAEMWKTALAQAGNRELILERIAEGAALENVDAAISACERLVQLKPSPERHLKLASLLTSKSRLIDEPQKAEVLVRAEKAARLALRAGQSAESLYRLADILEDEGAYSESADNFRRAFELSRKTGRSDDEANALRGLVRTAYSLKRDSEGQRWFQALVETGKATFWDWSSQADRLSGRGAAADAGLAYQSAAVLGGSWKNWCHAASQFSLVPGRSDDVLRNARKCIEVGSGKTGSEFELTWAHISVADVLNERAVHEEALSHAREAVALQSSNSWAYAAQANALFALRRFQEAINASKQAIRLSDGKYSSMHFRLGTSYFETENWEFARQSFEQAAALDPKDTAAPYNVALCLIRLRFYGDAARWYEEVLRRDPNHRERQDLLMRIEALRR